MSSPFSSDRSRGRAASLSSATQVFIVDGAARLDHADIGRYGDFRWFSHAPSASPTTCSPCSPAASRSRDWAATTTCSPPSTSVVTTRSPRTPSATESEHPPSRLPGSGSPCACTTSATPTPHGCSPAVPTSQRSWNDSATDRSPPPRTICMHSPTPTGERWTPSPGSGNAPLDPAKRRRRHWMPVKGASVRYGHRAPASRPGGARVAARRPSGHLVTSRGAGPTVGFRTGVSAGEQVAGLGDGFSARVHVEAGVHDLAFQRCGRSALRTSPLPAPGAPPPPRSTRQGRTAPPAATGRRSIRHWSVRPSRSDASHHGSSSGCVGTLTQPMRGLSSRWDRTGSCVQDSPMLGPYGHGHHERERGAGAAG